MSAFFSDPVPMTLEVLARQTGAQLALSSVGERSVRAIAPLENAHADAVSFLDNARYVRHLAATRAGACFVAAKFADQVPAGCAALVSESPYKAFAKAAALLFPKALRPQSMFEATGISPGAFIHPDARLEAGVIVDPGAVIGPRAEIGRGTVIAAHAVIGPDVRIGRDCAIGAQASVTHSLLGNRVIVHPGARLGQDGFGFAMGPGGHLKVPQIGRVIVQDDVEIGANTTIDRGANRDTIIGEGTKIDNLVQIGHNVVIGRHCVIVGQVGIAGSSVLEDYVVLGGQVGLAGHVRIGQGAQISAQSGIMTDIAAGARMAGSPASPAREHFKQVAVLRKLAHGGAGRGVAPNTERIQGQGGDE